jgi:HEAT repeat protein
VARVADQVNEYASLLEQLSGSQGAERFSILVAEFNSRLREWGNIDSEIVEGLNSLLKDNDYQRVLLWINAAWLSKSAQFVKPLCELLAQQNTSYHEWIAELLGEIESPDAIEPLQKACKYDFGDFTTSRTIRCLVALDAIGTSEAIEAIKTQLVTPHPEVRKYAAELLSGGS